MRAWVRAFLGAVGTEEERQLAREHVAVAEIAAGGSRFGRVEVAVVRRLVEDWRRSQAGRVGCTLLVRWQHLRWRPRRARARVTLAGPLVTLHYDSGVNPSSAPIGL